MLKKIIVFKEGVSVIQELPAFLQTDAYPIIYDHATSLIGMPTFVQSQAKGQEFSINYPAYFYQAPVHPLVKRRYPGLSSFSGLGIEIKIWEKVPTEFRYVVLSHEIFEILSGDHERAIVYHKEYASKYLAASVYRRFLAWEEQVYVGKHIKGPSGQ